MSNNPFSDLPQKNPYSSPTALAPRGNPLIVPATFLLVLSILTLVMVLTSIPGQVFRMRAIDTSTPGGVGELTGSVVALVVWHLTTLSIIVGSIGMLRLKGYSGAMISAVISIVPICSPCFVLGMPFGIWAIVLLVRTEVKQSFT